MNPKDPDFGKNFGKNLEIEFEKEVEKNLEIEFPEICKIDPDYEIYRLNDEKGGVFIRRISDGFAPKQSYSRYV
jgi:hypothetical protein